jgi:hypothetical protein
MDRPVFKPEEHSVLGLCRVEEKGQKQKSGKYDDL